MPASNAVFGAGGPPRMAMRSRAMAAPGGAPPQAFGAARRGPPMPMMAMAP